MSAIALVAVCCDTCGAEKSELRLAATADQARRELAAAGWRVNVHVPDVARRLDFCPLHKAGT